MSWTYCFEATSTYIIEILQEIWFRIPLHIVLLTKLFTALTCDFTDVLIVRSSFREWCQINQSWQIISSFSMTTHLMGYELIIFWLVNNIFDLYIQIHQDHSCWRYSIHMGYFPRIYSIINNNNISARVPFNSRNQNWSGHIRYVMGRVVISSSLLSIEYTYLKYYRRWG